MIFRAVQQKKQFSFLFNLIQRQLENEQVLHAFFCLNYFEKIPTLIILHSFWPCPQSRC